MQIFSVGGSVRDELLGRGAQDRDFVVLQASEEEFLSRYPEAKRVGRQHSVYIHKGREYTLSHSATIQEDLRQRDLTINALARDVYGRYYGLPGSFSDLRLRILRPVHPDNFFRDPLRVLRAARMAACLPQFIVHPQLETVLRDLAKSGSLGRVASERAGREAVKACSCPNPGRFLEVLCRNRCLSPWLVLLSQVRDLGSASWREEPLLARQAATVMDRVAGEPTTVWMALCHCLGSLSYASEPSAIWEAQAASLARDIGQRLRLSKRLIGAGEAAAGWITAGGNYPRLPTDLQVDLLLGLYARSLVQPMLRLIQAVAKLDLQEQVYRDLELVLSIKLPPEYRKLGPLSGQVLKDLRCRALERNRRLKR